MQIQPNSSLLQALTRAGQSPAVAAPPRTPSPQQADAARAAARAVFAQLKSSPVASTAARQAQVVAPTPSQAPDVTPGRNLPRGSIINILV